VTSLAFGARNVLIDKKYEKCWAHLPLRDAVTLPFTRCRYCRTPAIAIAQEMSTTTTTTTTTRDRGDRYGPMEWAQLYIVEWTRMCTTFLVAPLACCDARLNQSGCHVSVCLSVCVWKFFSDQPLSPSWFDRSRWNLAWWVVVGGSIP